MGFGRIRSSLEWEVRIAVRFFDIAFKDLVPYSSFDGPFFVAAKVSKKRGGSKIPVT